MSYLSTTYGAGKRCGMAPKTLIVRQDGTKIIAPPSCPFKKRTQVIARALWWDGYYTGLMQSLNMWLVKRSRQGVQL